jgi:hypothetical protein
MSEEGGGQPSKSLLFKFGFHGFVNRQRWRANKARWGVERQAD